jgi:hypothetical protein
VDRDGRATLQDLVAVVTEVRTRMAGLGGGEGETPAERRAAGPRPGSFETLDRLFAGWLDEDEEEEETRVPALKPNDA